MLLTIDVGNTQIAAGLFRGEEMLAHWRIATRLDQTEDELAAVFGDLLELASLKLSEVESVAIGSVVPSLTSAFAGLSRKYVGVEPFIVDSTADTGLRIGYRNPEEVGADRILNAVAGLAKYGGPLVIVDFGTATTFDAVSADGVYMGGSIAPGILVSSEALFRKAARLFQTDLIAPESAIGTDTSSSIRSGVILGTAGMVDYLVGRISAELGGAKEVIATGGLAEMIYESCSSITKHEPFLTLEGLEKLHARRSRA
ncbi:MAG: type III pantothenate kinase [Candidatus Aquicultorales bacterium]